MLKKTLRFVGKKPLGNHYCLRSSNNARVSVTFSCSILVTSMKNPECHWGPEKGVNIKGTLGAENVAERISLGPMGSHAQMRHPACVKQQNRTSVVIRHYFLME